MLKEQIDQLRAQGSNTLSDTIRVNEAIAALYRKYHQVLFKDKQSNGTATTYRSSSYRQRSSSHQQRSHT